MNMVYYAHSGLRYLVLLAGIAAIIILARGRAVHVTGRPLQLLGAHRDTETQREQQKIYSVACSSLSVLCVSFFCVACLPLLHVFDEHLVHAVA